MAPLAVCTAHLLHLLLQLLQLQFFLFKVLVEHCDLLLCFVSEKIKFSACLNLVFGCAEKIVIGLAEDSFHVFKFAPKLLILSFDQYKVIYCTPFFLFLFERNLGEGV
jgi:hypothetical protein